MSSKKAAVTLTAYEDLFSSEAERQEVNREQVQNVPLELFHPFPNHPFKVLDDEKMQDTVQSISEFGVLVPVLARPRQRAAMRSCPDIDGFTPVSWQGARRFRLLSAL